jgi:hypothetical protein
VNRMLRSEASRCNINAISGRQLSDVPPAGNRESLRTDPAYTVVEQMCSPAAVTRDHFPAGPTARRLHLPTCLSARGASPLLASGPSRFRKPADFIIGTNVGERDNGGGTEWMRLVNTGNPPSLLTGSGFSTRIHA